MNAKIIHIVSFDIPYPADYGGVQDVFSRIQWFAKNGYEVHLHCFEYSRKRAVELNEYATVHYYKRTLSVFSLFSSLPFIVKTRINRDLAQVLSNTNDLVLLEGLHCAWYMTLQPGKFWLRAHNIEHEYYEQLAKQSSYIKQFYYRIEAKKLKRYEEIVRLAKGVLAITPKDEFHLKQYNSNCLWLPPLFNRGTEFAETKPYILFHGNLTVEENIRAAHWVLDELAPSIHGLPLIIAGKNPSLEMVEKSKRLGVEVVANPCQNTMSELVKNAHIHLLYSNQKTGIKLKLLNALSGSGFIICNENIIAGTNLEEHVHIAETSTIYLATIQSLILQKLSFEEWEKRQERIEDVYGETQLTQIAPLL